MNESVSISRDPSEEDDRIFDRQEKSCNEDVLVEDSAQHQSKSMRKSIRFPRCWHTFVDQWPRTFAIVHRQLLVYSLLAVTLVGGFALSKLESPYEVSKNDLFLRNLWLLNALPIHRATEALVGLPTACLLKYQNEVEGTLDHNTAADQVTPFSPVNVTAIEFQTNPIKTYLGEVFGPEAYSFFIDSNTSIVEMIEWINNTFPEKDSFLPNFETTPPTIPLSLPPVSWSENDTDLITADDVDGDASTVSQSLYEYMVACEELAGELLSVVVNFTVEVVRRDFELITGADAGPAGLTFNWNRCWNSTEFGHSDPFFPTTKQIEASQYRNQTDYYSHIWNNHREELFQNYTIEMGCLDIGDENTANKTVDIRRTICYYDALKYSVLNATGGEGCRTNTGSAAWFWFTIMTTVGYGNFSPNTSNGQLLVYLFGWLSIIVFGGIMILAGTTYAAIVDDISRRFNLKWLQHPIYSTIFWGIVSVFWIVLVAFKARRFWDTRTPGFEYTLADSYWFSYITVLTVGLGDFVLQPEGIFAGDVMQWTTLLLHGFVFITSFLGKVGDLFESLLPKSGESFENHLSRTDICCVGYNVPISKSLETLKDMVDELENSKAAAKPLHNEESTRTIPRTSFIGEETKIARDGQTMNQHRIRILLEKKKLLIRLLEANEEELEHRMEKTPMNQPTGIAATFHESSGFFTNLKDLQYEETVLGSSLTKTKEIRMLIEDFQSNKEVATA